MSTKSAAHKASEDAEAHGASDMRHDETTGAKSMHGRESQTHHGHMPPSIRKR